MTFADLQNRVLKRLRQRGVNFGGAPTNQATDWNPPYEVAQALNEGYNVFLSKVKDYPIATLQINVTTIANTPGFSLMPAPADTINNVLNPAVMQVYEYVYVQATGQSRYIPTLSTAKYRALTGNYTQLQGAFAPFPRAVCQKFGQRYVSAYPALSTSGDQQQLTVCPDPQATSRFFTAAQVPCSQGNIMSAPGDVPIMPDEYHVALMYYAAAVLAEDADKIEQGKRDMQRFEDLVDDAREFGAVTMEGGAEQIVQDPYDNISFDPAVLT